MPKFRFFRSVRFPGDWEANLIIGKLSARIGRSQCALWWNYTPLAQWLSVRATA